MNIKTLKILKKWANLQVPGPVYENVCINLFQSLSLKEKINTLKEIKLFLVVRKQNLN